MCTHIREDSFELSSVEARSSYESAHEKHSFSQDELAYKHVSSAIHGNYLIARDIRNGQNYA